MDSTLVTVFVTGIMNVITWYLGYMKGRKKRAAEMENLLISNLRSTIDIYRITHEEQIKFLKSELSELRLENILLKEEIRLLKLR